MLRRRHRGEDGVVALNLVLVLGFALFAVVQLSRTALATEQINERVKRIVGQVGPINQNLDSVPKLDQTDVLAKQILASSTPLSAEAGDIIDAAKSIDGTVSSIQSKAGSINGTVKGINGTFTALSPVVRSINDGVSAINGRVDKVMAAVQGIRADLNNVLAEVGTLKGSSKGILGHANSIDCSTAVSGSACER